jgi:hypothetical protein
MTRQGIDQKELFTLLVTQLHTSAAMQLGLSPNPVTRRTEKNLEAATMTIGILEALLFKTAGNLNRKEDEVLSRAVRELRTQLQKETRKPL